jgi:polar amino acid transport system permease protein
MVADAPYADWSRKYAVPAVAYDAGRGRGVQLTIRHIALTGVFAFAAGIILASMSGFHEWMPLLLRGAWVTIQLTVIGCILAVIFAFIAAFGKMSAIRPVRWLAIAYIEVFRGTSALVQLFWLFFVLPQFGVTLPPFLVAVLALGLNVGAYGSEVVRGAILGVQRGQWEAATALNMTRATAIRRIILPQAFVAMIPPWGNLFIELLKATSLVSLITLADLTFKAQTLNQSTFKTVPIFTLVLLMYLALSLVLTIGMRWLENRAALGLSRGRAR